MAVDVQGVRINPGIIQFFDSDVGVPQKCLVSVKNISEKTRTIRFYAPQNKIFVLKVKEHEKNVASGLDHVAHIEYSPADENTQSDRLIVTVDGEVVQVPIQGMPRQPVLEISDSVNIGVVVVANKVVTTNVKLYNRGSKPGDFRFEYSGDRPLSILPPHGSIPPKAVLPVRFDYITKDPGKFNEEVTAVLEGRPETQKIAVLGEIVERQLELLNPSTREPMPCVHFGSAFYGTDKTEAAVLFNNAPEPVSFVSILEENAIGQESGPVSKSANMAEAKECTNPLTSLVSMVPNQGTIAPYQKALVCFRFSPRWYKSKRSFHTTEDRPPKQEFALFMYIQLVGTQTDAASPDSHRTQLEVALTGTALPILLTVSPQPELDFGPVALNSAVEAAFKLTNQSDDALPVMFAFRKIAHFNAHPERGQIEPGRELPVRISFCPRQFGEFAVQLEICILGEVADQADPLHCQLDVIHSVFMRLAGSCRVFGTQPKAKFNPGISPIITNEVGLCAETRFGEEQPAKPRAAVVARAEARLHKHQAAVSASEARKAVAAARIAFPNDRAASVRPFERHIDYYTLFTRVKRHNFVDPDYAYEDSEVERVKRHKQGYADSQRRRTENLIVSQRDRRLKKFENERDMGMIPAMGMQPLRLGLDDLRPDTPPPEPPNKLFQLLSTKEIQDVKETAAHQLAKDGLSAVPMTQKEKEECQMLLRPQELHQVVITPGTIDFEVVCLRSVVTKELTVMNNLETCIHLVVEIDCRELRHSSPLSQVVPPKSKAVVPLIFESALQGRFQRNVSYVINGNYRNHVIALAEVVPVQLELSTRVLEVLPCEGQPAEAGIRGVITLYNRLNHHAEFSWEPVLKERQHTAFSIRPRVGIVDAFKDIDCEVVFRPSFNAPDEGYFRLHVEGGSDLDLKCVAKFGPTNVQFVNRRVMFGSVPLNMTTMKKAVLVNNSQNHAYFHVINSKPWPGMELEPLSGVVPVGGQKEIRISFTPSAVSKFDCGTRVAIRGWRDMELRMGGTILSPCVDIPLKEFNFDGVYVGASKSIEFQLVNRTQTDSRLEFDLKRYPDFSLDFAGPNANPEDLAQSHANPGVYTVTLRSEETLKAVLTFRPKEVASYSFLMPVIINNTRAPSPAATPVPPSPAPTVKDGVSMSRANSAGSSAGSRVGWTPHVPVVQTPRKLIKGIALRPVLRLSQRRFAFQLAPEALQEDATPPRGQLLTLENTGDAEISWAVDLPDRQRALREGHFGLAGLEGATPAEERTDAGRRLFGRLLPGSSVTLSVQFSPKRPGKFKARLPVVINENWQFPYDELRLEGELTWPSISFAPQALTLTPCPLHSAVSVQFSVLAANYAAPSRLSFTLPQLEADDGSPIAPLALEYLDGCGPDILPTSKDPDSNGYDAAAPLIELRCRLTFQSASPVSFSKEIIFQDTFGNQARLPVSATADNCLLTLYPFVLKHRDDYHIVTEQGKFLEGRSAHRAVTEAGEPQMVACRAEDLPGMAAASSRPSTTATSCSNFEDSSTSYEDSMSQSAASNTPREGAVNNPASSSKATGQSGPRVPGMVGKSGKTKWPDHPLTESSSEGLMEENFHLEREGLYYRDMLSLVQRWFTNYGWPGGQYPVTVPNSMRSGLSRKQQSDEEDRKKKPTAAAGAGDAKGDTGGGGNGAALDSGGGKSEVKTLYDMITHLCGRPAPGIPISAALPSQPTERVRQIYWQHATLLTFLRSQGGCLSSVRPEHLMEPKDYKYWKTLPKPAAPDGGDGGGDGARPNEEDEENDGVEPSPGRILRDLEEASRDEELFECVSKRAWTDVLLQILKTLVLYKVTPRSLKNLRQPDPRLPLPSINLSPLASNVYTVNERILLAWLNHFYENYRTVVWADSDKGGIPPARWVINFDHDLLDGLVLAAVLGAHCPYLIGSHLGGMYTAPSSPEQCLHNSLRVVNAMRFIGLDFDVQALDLTAPNPMLLLLLCVHLYQTLPQYIIKASVDFAGGLHQPCSRQVTLVNPVSKTLAYRAVLAGKDAADFSLPKGDLVSLPPKGRVPVSVEFRSRFLRPAEAVLLLIGRPSGPHQGTTQVFRLVTQVNAIQPISVVHVSSHCYQLKPVRLGVVNPFDRAATFSVALVEGGTEQLLASGSGPDRHPADKKKKPQQQPQGKSGGPPPQRSLDKDTDKATTVGKSDASVSMKSFFCHVPEIRLDARGSGEIDMNFLPFQVDKKQCSVVFRNNQVGEFVYSVEATSDLPMLTKIPMDESATTKTVRISSAIAASRGQSSVVHDHSVVYWRTEANKEAKEVLKIPLSNEFKEQALLQAAQQHLSAKEVQRRRVTGTLESGTLVEKAMEMLSSVAGAKKPEKSSSTLEKRKFQFNKATIDFHVELDSQHFKAPSVISIPHPKSTDNSLKKDPTVTTFDLPLEFKPKRPGVYPVTIILKANDDVRLFKVECIVIPEGLSAELQFESPVNQTVQQSIPVINQTKDDWRLKAEVRGHCFHGPDYLLAKAYKTTSYPLTFKPTHEGATNGRLLLTNLEDGTEHSYSLEGVGRKPLALDHLVFDCQVGENITRVVLVPNNSKRKLLYQVESNLTCVGGKKEVTVLPGRQVEYTVIIAPNKRGKFDGVIAFVADKDRLVDYDSDGEELPPVDDNPTSEHRVWYSIELDVAPGEPMGRLEVTCPCYRTSAVEFAVRNPLADREIQLEAEICGESLKGEKQLRLGPSEEKTYTLDFSPALVGNTVGSVIFFNSEVGEFWYELNLNATPPPLTVLEPMECELGQHVCQELTLENPSSAPVVLRPQLSNTNNFGLEIADDLLRIPAGDCVTLNLRFTPSDLGFADHSCRITFHSDELKEWIFEVNGSGLMPTAQNPVAITAPAGTNSTLIIPFHNPLDVPVLCDILLTDSGQPVTQAIKELEESPFCLLLKHCRKIHLEPKARLDVPVSFAPENMQQHEAVCVIIMRRRDGSGWHYCPDDPKSLPRSDSGGIAEIRWRFRVIGVPESKATDDGPEKAAAAAPLISCPARTVAEDRLEVWLAGVAPTPGAPQALIQARTRTPAGGQSGLPAGVDDAVDVPEPFTFSLVSLDDSLAELLERSVKLELLRQVRDSRTGMVVLTFAVALRPFKTFRVRTHLVIKSNAGGFWRYPLTVESTDPEPDDVITIHAAGLDRASKVTFRLTSKELYPVKFHAYFEKSHDSADFQVEPQSGELPPHGSDGLPFSVTFLPSYYGKPKRVRLVIHTADMEWTYIVVGEIPEYLPPAGRSLPPVSGPHPNPIVRTGRPRNFVRQNLKLEHTGPSSPLKLAPLMCKREKVAPPL